MFYLLFMIVTALSLILGVYGLICTYKVGFLITMLGGAVLISIASSIANDPYLIVDTIYEDGVWVDKTVMTPFYPYTPLLLALTGGLFLLMAAYGMKRE